MTKICLINEAKKQYIISPYQVVVGVGNTHLTPVLNTKDHAPINPEPPATIAECSLLRSQQYFDITALIEVLSGVRPVKDNRIVFDVDIINGYAVDHLHRAARMRSNW